jgi:hypothetical protein
MAADPNIFQQYLKPVRSMADYSADLDAQEENQLKMAAARQTAADDRAMRSAYQQSGGDQNKLMQALQAGGNYKAAQALQTQLLGQQKTQSDIELSKAHAQNFGATTAKTEQETKFATVAQHAQDIAGIRTPQDIVTYLDQGIAKGIFPADQRDAMLQKANQYPSVEAFKQAATQNAIPVLDRYKAEAENSRAAATVAATQRGQDIGAQTAAAGRAQSERHFGVTQAAGKVPAGYRANPDGSMSFIPGGPADPSGSNKPLTEFQGKSAAFGDRAMKADKILKDLTGNYSPGAISLKQGLGNVWGVGGALEAGANIALSENSQKVEQAQRDFINALLRQESGAAISSGEFSNAAKQYFPQPGDSKGVIEQKAANRKTSIDGFIRSAGSNAKIQVPSSSQHAPEIEFLLKKYGQ